MPRTAKKTEKPGQEIAGRHYYPTPKQELALECTCQTVLFGGARGGGKSFCSYLKILQHIELYKENAKILFLRRSLKELEQIIDDCKVVFFGIAVWKEQKKRFEFNNGAVAEFNYLDGEAASNYQGHQYSLIICDEVGNFGSYDDVKLLKGCLRSAAGVPCQLFMTCNPGGPLHNILKSEFIDPAPKGMVPIEDTEADGTPMGTFRVYIPAWLFENPHLMKNDPTYIQRLKQTGSAEMVRAWLKGDWDIISGGAFDKLFDRDIHVIRPFRIPSSWRIIESYDDGMTKPATDLWFAISDGSDYYLPNGERRSTIRGDIFVIAELYFWNGKPNEGSAESIQSKAEKIKQKEKQLGYEISRRIADSAIFSSKTKSPSDDFAENGVAFDRCNKAPGTRLIAANLFRNALMGSLVRMEKPGIFFFSTCVHCIRTIPTLPRDKKEPDDVDSGAEDHCLHGDTIIHTIEYGDVPIRELVGKTGHCMTAGGYFTRFNNCRCFQRDAEMMEIETVDNHRIVCTKDHRILTDTLNYAEAGQWMLSSFRKTNKVLTVKFSINADRISNMAEDGCIESYGNSIWEKYLMEQLSTTSTETRGTIKSAICRLSQARGFTPKCTNLQIRNLPCRKSALKRQRIGINQTKGNGGISNIMNLIAQKRCISNTRQLAKYAGKLFRLITKEQNTVADTTEILPGKEAELTTKKESVLSAEAALLATNICTIKPVPGAVSEASSVKYAKVLKEKSDAFCLTTDGTHSIVVNDGIVVSNCYDCVCYLLLSDYDATVQVFSAGNC